MPETSIIGSGETSMLFRHDSHRVGKEDYDDLTGAGLGTSMVMAARAEEMKEFVKRYVCNKVPLTRCLDLTGKVPIGVRWVDVNKGDIHNTPWLNKIK